MALDYLIREPETMAEKSPLLLLLHGYGSNEADLFSFAEMLPPTYYVVSVRAPHTLMRDSFAWFALDFTADEKRFSNLDQARESLESVADFIDYLLQKYPIDPKGVTLIGFSQGAILSYALSFKYPEKVHRVAALSGYLNAEIFDLLEPSDKHTKLRYFVSHGSVDQVVPVQWARKAPEFLRTLGSQVTFKEYPVGHGVAPQNFADLLQWLNEIA